MARYIGPRYKRCRRAGVNLGHGEKFSVEGKNVLPPGQHGARRARKMSNYGIQLREKQKVKWYYGVLERQFRKYFDAAAKNRGATGITLLQLLEMRLDHAVYLLGFAPTKPMARQLVNHGHVLVNGKKVSIPSYEVSAGEVINLNGKASNLVTVLEAMKERKEQDIPSWLERKAGAGVVKAKPEREQITLPIQEQLIVEYYSR
jgi:small subunit ribosomal protein S4